MTHAYIFQYNYLQDDWFSIFNVSVLNCNQLNMVLCFLS